MILNNQPTKPMNETPTPRTDALRNKLHENINTHNIVKYMETVLHANELERELTAVTAQRDRLAEALQNVIDEDGTPRSIVLANEILKSLTLNQP